MRLLNIHSLQFREFLGKDIPGYCILSHRWGDDEISYKEFRKQPRHDAAGYRKIIEFCEFVKRRRVLKPTEGMARQGPEACTEDDLVEWVWIGIDKRSSAELTEAINSMFSWYQAAVECIVYLRDLPGWKRADRITRQQAFRTSEWFSRGWTLQELLAPFKIIFCDAEWEIYGQLKHYNPYYSPYLPENYFMDEVSKITGIDAVTLRNPFSVREKCVAQRMSWAAKRKTTRVEDEAYCLMGIFQVNMPLIYGEGQAAFRRLQEEIVRRSTDSSIFAWHVDWPKLETGALAPSACFFKEPWEIKVNEAVWPQPYTISNGGLELHTRLYKSDIPWFGGNFVHVIWLNCLYWVEQQRKWRAVPMFLGSGHHVTSRKDFFWRVFVDRFAERLEKANLEDLGKRLIYVLDWNDDLVNDI